MRKQAQKSITSLMKMIYSQDFSNLQRLKYSIDVFITYRTIDSLFIYLFCTSCKHEIGFAFQNQQNNFRLTTRDSTQNQLSNFGLIIKNMDLSPILLSVISPFVSHMNKLSFICVSSYNIFFSKNDKFSEILHFLMSQSPKF